MKHYESPMILLNEELAEGVYTASGDTEKVTANAQITGNNGNDIIYFDCSVKNNTDETIVGWSITLSFDGPITEAQVYNCNITINGNSITIANGYDWNATIAPNGEMRINGQVKGNKILELL